LLPCFLGLMRPRLASREGEIVSVGLDLASRLRRLHHLVRNAMRARERDGRLLGVE
jgi:hypothetical protein